jgi:hypothetical protein
MDSYSLTRILRGDDELVAEDKSGSLRCRRIDLGSFIAAGLGLQQWTLQHIYQMYFPESEHGIMDFHDALFDAKTTAKILNWVREDTRALWDEISGAAHLV